MKPHYCLAIMAVIWVALAATIVAILTAGPGSSWLEKYDRLSKDGIETRGTVTKTEPKNHQTVRYAYQVEGRD